MPTEPKVVAIIPARWESSRFPGKPLENICGKPMIQWVIDNVRKAQRVSEILVATDDKRIFDVVSKFGCRAVMTSKKHVSGTDRIAEVAADISCNIVINIQGDEPLLPPSNIDLVVQPMLLDSIIQVSTLMTPIRHVDELFDHNVTKTVADHNGFALYFSRSPIPFNCDQSRKASFQDQKDASKPENIKAFKHIGIYAYRKSFLMQFSQLPNSSLENIEKLEQLRILENGIPIKITETQEDSIGVNCPKDIEKIQQLLKEPVSS